MYSDLRRGFSGDPGLEGHSHGGGPDEERGRGGTEPLRPAHFPCRGDYRPEGLTGTMFGVNRVYFTTRRCETSAP